MSPLLRKYHFRPKVKNRRRERLHLEKTSNVKQKQPEEDLREHGFYQVIFEILLLVETFYETEHFQKQKL